MKKVFTVIIVPNDKEKKPKRIVFDIQRIYGLIAVFAVLVLILSSVSFSYRKFVESNNSNADVQQNAIITAQAKEIQILQDSLSKLQSDVDALKEYVVSLNDIEKQVRSSLKLNGSNISLDAILKESQPTLQSYTNIAESYAKVDASIQNVAESAKEAGETLGKLQSVTYIYNLLVAETPDYWPVTGSVTAYFGWRPNPFGGSLEYHEGIDIADSYGTPVRSAGKGEVVFTGFDAGGYGKMIVIFHRNGIESVYAHLSSINVSIGDKVEKGEIIGAVGSSGESTGSHLHFEIRENGDAVNPLKYLK